MSIIKLYTILKHAIETLNQGNIQMRLLRYEGDFSAIHLIEYSKLNICYKPVGQCHLVNEF